MANNDKKVTRGKVTEATGAIPSRSKRTNAKNKNNNKLGPKEKVENSKTKEIVNANAITDKKNSATNIDKTKVVKPMPNGGTRAKKFDPNRKANGKKKPGKVRTFFRTFLITLMVAYVVVMGIIGYWAFTNFFQFMFAEKAPVMGVGTENSRIIDTPIIEAGTIESGRNAIENSDKPIEKITVRQVGPSIHFYIVVAADVDRDTARGIGRDALIIFSDTLENPEMFGTYEAQLIVTKAELPELTPEQQLRPVTESGEEQAFPQFGVSNKNTNGVERNISWSHNG